MTTVLFAVCLVLPSVLGSNTSSTKSCSNINLITRNQWGARVPKHTSTIHVPVHEFFIHHTEQFSCYDIKHCAATVKFLQDFHMNIRGWDDIGYSFLIGEDGNVYEGRGWTRVGAHTKTYNDVSFAASFMGNYRTHLPGSKALNAAKNLVACGVDLGMITTDYRLFGHRDASATTTCPGDALYKEIQTWPRYSHSHP